MNKAFEKILEMLEEPQFDIGCGACPYKDKCDEVQETIDDEMTDLCAETMRVIAKQIVQEVAKENNCGWIPCSDMMPEEHQMYDITFRNSAGVHSDSAIYNTYLKRWFWDADETELVENEVLAWAEKREPYQPKGE